MMIRIGNSSEGGDDNDQRKQPGLSEGERERGKEEGKDHRGGDEGGDGADDTAGRRRG